MDHFEIEQVILFLLCILSRISTSASFFLVMGHVFSNEHIHMVHGKSDKPCSLHFDHADITFYNSDKHVSDYSFPTPYCGIGGDAMIHQTSCTHTICKVWLLVCLQFYGILDNDL